MLKIHQPHQLIQEQILLNKMSHGATHTQELEQQSQFAMELMLEHALKHQKLSSIKLEDLLREQHQETQTMSKMLQLQKWFQSLVITGHQLIVILPQLPLSKPLCHGEAHIQQLVMLSQSAMVETMVTASKQLKLLNTD